MGSAARFQAVIFDSDGVLINSAAAIIAAQEQVLGEYGISAKDLKGHHHSHSVKLLLETVLREHGVTIDPAEFTPKLIDQILGRLSNAQLDPGLAIFLSDLKIHGIPMAVGTSATRPSIEGKLNILGLTGAFDVVVTADDVASHKPAPDVYLKAASMLGSDISRCVVIEDSPAGAEAGRSAGAYVVGFGKYNDDPRAHFGAHIHVSDWPELSYERLRSLIGDNYDVK